MGNYEQLKQSVSDVIKTNGNQEITGSILQNVLLTIISSVGANATFAGIATPATNPGTPDGPVFYLASEGGTYTNFNAIELQDGLSVLMWNGSWSSQQILIENDYYLNNPQIRPIEKWRLSGFYLDSSGNPVDEYDHWNSYRISPLGMNRIMVKGLSNYGQSRLCFYKKEISSSDLLLNIEINSSNTGWIDIPECGVIGLSFKTVDTIELQYQYEQAIPSLLKYREPFEFVNALQIQSDGTVASHNGYRTTDKIELIGGEKFEFALKTYLSAGYALYNENDEVVAVFLGPIGTYENTFTFELQQYPTAKYIRFCTLTECLSSSYIRKVRMDTDFLYKKIAKNENDIKEHNEKIEDIYTKISDIDYTNKYDNTYLDKDSLTLIELNGWTTYRFPAEENLKYNVFAHINNGYVVALVSLESSNGEYTVLDTGVGSGYHKFDGLVDTTEDTNYIVISQSSDLSEPYVLNTHFPSDIPSNEIINAWTQMIESDKFIEKVYFPRVANSRYIIESLYNYGNIHITEDYIKPSQGNTVTVQVNDSSKLSVNMNVAVGNYQTYDRYVITEISSNSVTMRLSADLSKYYAVGDAIPAILSTSYEGKELLSEYSSNIYNWKDILSLQNQDIPETATFDGIHPTNEVYNLFGKALADMIKPLLKDETRIVVYGDSWGEAGIYPAKIETELGITVLNKSRSGDSTMYIRKRFIEDFNNNVVSNNDFFIFQMGTNNLFRWGATSGTAFIGPVGQVMKDYQFHFAEDCRMITALLKGNYIIAPGHAGTSAYNPNI